MPTVTFPFVEQTWKCCWTCCWMMCSNPRQERNCRICAYNLACWNYENDWTSIFRQSPNRWCTQFLDLWELITGDRTIFLCIGLFCITARSDGRICCNPPAHHRTMPCRTSRSRWIVFPLQSNVQGTHFLLFFIRSIQITAIIITKFRFPSILHGLVGSPYLFSRV